ncbi:MAG: 2-amino-4-hydroxy-6-hydroxymethyldihydropteridine diphosphokinase [Nitrospirae bacterium]|nr:2-amino-4-hydroxy-6-hydroxymethyldihydropteridine diphosphokinase [Nitrospirota bacterium]
MPVTYLSIGSNLGRRQENCERAVSLLAENGIKILKCSSMIETKPWGIKDQPDFINMAVEAETSLKPEELLKAIKKIENEMGRHKSVRWGPRPIDVDILFYDDLIIKTPELEIPHPLIHERYFVLNPLAEIAPEKVHPVLKKSIKTLWLELSGTII